LQKKLKERDSGLAPRVGDRVPYVIVQGNKSSKISERSEDPMYVLQNRLQIDSQYYLKNQLKNPICRIFKRIIGKEETTNLLQGKHTLKKKGFSFHSEAPTQKGTLTEFFTAQSRCLCGKNVVKKGEKPVCKQCEQKIPNLYQEKLKYLRLAEFEQNILWTECQRCQNS
jgi:DNA polymerase delta subunit 1